MKVDTNEYYNAVMFKRVEQNSAIYRSVTMFTGQEVSKEQLGPLYYIQLLEENRK